MLGALGYVAYGVESTEGTPVARTKMIPVNSFDMDSPNDIIVPDQIRRSRDHSVGMDGVIAPEGGMEMELVPNDIGPLLQSAWTAQVVTAQNADVSNLVWDHTYTPGSVHPSLTMESNLSDVRQNLYAGTRVNSLALKGAFGEIVTASFNLQGLDFSESADGLSVVTIDDVLPFHFSGTRVTIAGGVVGYVQEFSFETGNNLERRGGLNKTRKSRRQDVGFRDVDLGLTVDFDATSDAEVDRFIARSEFAVILEFEGEEVVAGSTTKPKLLLTIPRVKFKKAMPALSAGDFLQAEIETQVLRPRNGDPIFTAVLTNGENAAAHATI